MGGAFLGRKRLSISDGAEAFLPPFQGLGFTAHPGLRLG